MSGEEKRSPWLLAHELGKRRGGGGLGRRRIEGGGLGRRRRGGGGGAPGRRRRGAMARCGARGGKGIGARFTEAAGIYTQR